MIAVQRVEKVGDTILVTFTGGGYLILPLVDAVNLGQALIQVAVLGGDTLDTLTSHFTKDTPT